MNKAKKAYLLVAYVFLLVVTLGVFVTACDTATEHIETAGNESQLNDHTAGYPVIDEIPTYDVEAGYMVDYPEDNGEESSRYEYLDDYEIEYAFYYDVHGYDDYDGYAYYITQEIQNEALVEVLVTRVIDGDTFEIHGGDRVRLIGVNTPESHQPGGSEATYFVRYRIYNQVVWLEADGNDTDRYGRLRRLVWLQVPTDSTDPIQIQRYMLNALLLSYGLAEVSIFGVVQNADLFHEIAQPLVFAETEHSDDSETMVWLSATGTRWHSINNCGTMNPDRARQVTLEYARAQANFAPCRNCNPPR